MESSEVARKLKIKENYKICVMDAPKGYSEILEPLPEGVVTENELVGEYDLIQAFIVEKNKLIQMVPLIKDHLKKNGIIWISYPKMPAKVETDLNRDIIRETVEVLDTKTVSMISINETWSAIRLKCL